MSHRQQRAHRARRKKANAKMRALGVAGGVAVASLGAAVPAQAAFDHVYTVTNTGDSATTGSGSLRDAITQANMAGGNDEILFQSGLSGTISLGTNLATVTTPLTIAGPGARTLELNASGDTSATGYALYADAVDLTVSGLTLSGAANGFVDDANAPLTLSGDTFTHNGTTEASAAGDNGSTLTVISSTFSDNASTEDGAAIYDDNGAVTVMDSTFEHNTSGGVGAAITSFAAPVVITGSTIVDNAATGTGPVSNAGQGGGIYMNAAPLTLQDTVVSGNTSTSSASGFTPHNDIDLAGSATLTSNFSLIGTLDGQTTGVTDNDTLDGQDPKLGPVQNNGGPTDTELPLAGSPLLDAGQAFGLTTDQRGTTRPVRVAGTTLPTNGDGSDIGAVEAQPLALSGVSPAGGPAGSSVTISGSGFSGATGVSFGSTPASSFHVVDDGHITAVVPAGTGVVDVRVTTSFGQTTVAAADHFTYPAPVTTTTTTTTATTSAPARPVVGGLSAHSGSSGESVRISGSHLTGVSVVRFGSVKAKFKVTSDGLVTATVPASHGKVDVTVTGPGGTSTTGAGDRFSYLAASVGHHNASAKWKGSHVVVDTGLFAICPKGGDRCSVSAKAVSSVPASLARVRKAKTKSLTLGSASFHVNAGKRGEVTFTLTRKGLKALEKLGKLKITVAVTVVDGSVTTKQSRTITIHLPKKPKPKPKKK